MAGPDKHIAAASDQPASNPEARRTSDGMHHDGTSKVEHGAYAKMFSEVGEAAARGAAAGGIARAVKPSEEAPKPGTDGEKTDRKEHKSLTHLDLSKPLDAKTVSAVDKAADQLVKSHGKDHSLADKVMQHAFLTDPKHDKGEKYAEVYKALSDGVGKRDHHETVVASLEHGRIGAKMVASNDNYYGANNPVKAAWSQKIVEHKNIEQQAKH